MFRKAAWSPYVCGAIIGLLQIPAFLILGKGLGTFSSFVKISAHVLSFFGLSLEKNPYFHKYMTAPENIWQIFLVIGIIIGAYLSSKASNIRRSLPSPIWQQDFKLNDKGRYVLAFIGGFFLIFGTRLAGGATSGHSLSGIGQLSVSSFLATISMLFFALMFIFLWKFIVNRK